MLRLCQELAGSVAAAGIDLVPLVEGGGGRLEHDVELRTICMIDKNSFYL